MTWNEQIRLHINRRTFLARTGAGVGATALASLLDSSLLATPANSQQSVGIINPPHVPPKAKRIIYLYMAGGPSHLETFDHRPKLTEMHGKPMPESFTKGQPIAQLQGAQLKCFRPQHEFQRYGKSGQEISTIF